MDEQNSEPQASPSYSPPPEPAYYPPSPVAPARRRPPILWIILAVFSVLFLGSLSSTCGQMAQLQMGEEVVGTGSDRVGVVELMGPITDTQKPIRDIRAFLKRKDIQALVIRIDSPGGSVAPSQELFDEIRNASSKFPIVVSMGNLAASGGFWVAMAGDYIFASPGTITGSIGVISQNPDLKQVAEFLRFNMRTYKSGPHKDMGNPFRTMTESDDAVFMELIDDIYEQFVTIIHERRGIEVEEIKKFADGRVFTGRAAKKYGVVDQLGGLYDAAHKSVLMARQRDAVALGQSAETISTETDISLVYPQKPRESLLEMLTETAGRGLVNGISDRIEERAARSNIKLK
ncbi:MAG: signal peptide peptidase SppA [Myxococcota bacterium]|nr:signal peptide peptidase SppA [Myxococcota bacterium]